MESWKTVIDEMEKQKTTETTFLLELINYQYGYISYCLGNKDKEQAKKYLQLAEQHLTKLERVPSLKATVDSYKSAFFGFKIGISPLKAPFYGRKSIIHVKQAIENDSTLAFGHMQYGIAYFYMPAIFGGSKKIAIASFEKALILMETNSETLPYDWNYLNLLTLLGQSYEELKDYQKAIQIYKKALEFEPEFQWVKTELYPNILNKIQSNETNMSKNFTPK